MNYQMHVLINGRIADRYLHDGNWYIEGRKGTDYKIRLSNLTGKRTLFVPSVDGLSIIDGKTASKDSKGYILGPWQTLDVDGWLVDENTAAKFTFGHKNSSYSKESGHGTDNTGVIGLQVFQEKEYFPKHQYDYKQGISLIANQTLPMIGSVYRPFVGRTSAGLMGNATASIKSTVSSRRGRSGGQSVSWGAEDEAVSSLGTEFGESTKFKTHKGSFERANEYPNYVLALYYASASELNKLGIRMTWQKSETKKPNPFPGDYCKPPVNWDK